MRCFFGIILTILVVLPVHSEDLARFDVPLLLGQWYWFSEETDATPSHPYKAINLSFNSHYEFRIDMLRRDGQLETAAGRFAVNQQVLRLYNDNGSDQVHAYQLNHYQLQLQDAIFTKLLPDDLSGLWRSNSIEGEDVSEDVNGVSLKLRPDFLFAMQVRGDNGRSVTHRGVYLVEGGNLMLIYKEGRHSSQYQLASDTLRLTNDVFGMEAVLQRQRNE
ncbi:hypothetical protein [Salinivibrio sp. ES.052]|uniref:hypothetical protein n=1 Tax=Salinivibrio sp. ES.052 TaxID=1882823 RepID=UPI0009286233|nr:hypothetical protein [Salinivibrio sp. ES.052]SIN85590.1 hypothetical protein SAMN05444724_0893 [Salinivibrio sp. ES.052]